VDNDPQGPVNADNRKHAPIVMVHWDHGVRDEISEAKALLVKHIPANQCPVIDARRIIDRNPQSFLSAIDELLRTNPWAQISYVSAHGTNQGLHFLPDAADPLVTYAQIAEVFQRHQATQSLLSLVMGSCRAAAGGTPLRDMLPTCVNRYVGFTGQPKASEVAALVAGVIAGDVAFYQELQAQMERPIQVVPGSSLSEVLRQIAEPVINVHDPAIDRYLPNDCENWGFLFDYVRSDDGVWHQRLDLGGR